MARRQGQGLSPAQWEQEGYDAIVDLVIERIVVPWGEVESRITTGWKSFRKVQPLQLSGARKRLREDDPPKVIEESTGHDPAVTTLRIPFAPGHKREIERIRGEKRKLYRRYLAAAGNQTLCGKHGERVVLESLMAAASDGGLWVPPQRTGEVAEVNGVTVPIGPLDALAQILDLDRGVFEVPLVVEVKNVRHWIYPWARELWELLIKAAGVAVVTPVVPLLCCCFNSWSTFLLAQDVGFLTCPYETQVFSPDLDPALFDELAEEFALPITRHDGPLDPIVNWTGRLLRQSPPPSPPTHDVPFYRRQSERFSELAPTILDFDSLAGTLPDDTRRGVYDAFKARIRDVAPWPLTGGY